MEILPDETLFKTGFAKILTEKFPSRVPSVPPVKVEGRKPWPEKAVLESM